MSDIDRAGALWAWSLGKHPTALAAANPFRVDSDWWKCWQLGAAGEPFPEHLLVEVST